jgi:predicted nucleic acid-binding protein
LNEAVLDASVILKWYTRSDEELLGEARELRRRHEQADLAVVVPAILFLEILDVAGRRWLWDEAALLDLADELKALQVDVVATDLTAIATWISRGLSSYDAAYVALAETLEIPLVTDDARVASIAGVLAIPLADVR